MEIYKPTDINAIRERLLDGIRSYMLAGEAHGDYDRYTEAEIARCAAIVDAYLAKVEGPAKGNPAKIMAAVEEAILTLNALSAEFESLIETDQREDLCELIELAAHESGLHIEPGEDITEAWREW